MHTQLTLDTYAAWLAAEAKWRLTPEEQALLKHSYSYSRGDRNKPMTDEMKYLRNTKAREYRRVRTFEAYLKELERQRTKRPQHMHGASVRVKEGDSPIEADMRKRMNRIYKRSMERGLPFDLDLEHLVTIAEQLTDCPCCHQPVSYKEAQLDRHVPSLGYVKTNVNFLCSECNRLKSNHDVDSLERVLAYMKAGM